MSTGFVIALTAALAYAFTNGFHDASNAVAVLVAGLLAAVGRNLLTRWRGLPSSSAHALVGGLLGAGNAAAGTGAIRAMAALLDLDDLRQEIAWRELYRRCARIGDTVVEVADRIGYATAKAS